jgi:hypothetical protein
MSRFNTRDALNAGLVQKKLNGGILAERKELTINTVNHTANFSILLSSQ